jgi:hypothetical protein
MQGEVFLKFTYLTRGISSKMNVIVLVTLLIILSYREDKVKN